MTLSDMRPALAGVRSGCTRRPEEGRWHATGPGRLGLALTIDVVGADRGWGGWWERCYVHMRVQTDWWYLVVQRT
jgi:hypothetical protein